MFCSQMWLINISYIDSLYYIHSPSTRLASPSSLLQQLLLLGMRLLELPQLPLERGDLSPVPFRLQAVSPLQVQVPIRETDKDVWSM